MGYGIAIGALERGVRTLARQLEKQGLQTEVHVHRSSSRMYGPSYVELMATGLVDLGEGEQDEKWSQVKFLAGGYGDLESRGEIGGAEWRKMSSEGKKRLLSELERQGWKPKMTKVTRSR